MRRVRVIAWWSSRRVGHRPAWYGNPIPTLEAQTTASSKGGTEGVVWKSNSAALGSVPLSLADSHDRLGQRPAWYGNPIPTLRPHTPASSKGGAVGDVWESNSAALGSVPLPLSPGTKPRTAKAQKAPRDAVRRAVLRAGARRSELTASPCP